jgi:hypothetical protein
MLPRDNLVITFRRSEIPRTSFELFRERFIIEEYPWILLDVRPCIASRWREITWYFLFHLNSNCRILCIIPSNSELRTRLMIAARGLLLSLSLGTCGRTLLDTAYRLFEFCFSHWTGSANDLSLGGRVGRMGW